MRRAWRRSRTILPLSLLLLVVSIPLVAGSLVHEDGDTRSSELSISAHEAGRAPVQGTRHLPALLFASVAALVAAVVLGVERLDPSTSDRAGPRRVGAGGLALRAPPTA